MTGRERLSALFARRPADRLCWTTLVDDNTLRALPGDWAGAPALEFGRRLGADLLLLDGWGTGTGFASPAMIRPPAISQDWRQEGPRGILRTACPAGQLTAEFQNGHPCKYPVASLAELRVLRSIWEATRFASADDSAAFAAIDAAVGPDGLVTRFWGPSTIPRLLEFDMGAENFYYLLADHPAEMAELFDVMHRAELSAFAALAAGPCDVIILVENTSSFYISPDVYRRFNAPHVRDFVDIVHAAGKTAILHMCGHLRNLLPLIRQVGADGVHALTAPPFGDTPWELALDALGEDTILIGAFNPDVFLRAPLADIPAALDALYTPRLRRANLCCCCFADGLTVPLDRWLAVARWFDRHGARE